MSPARRCGVWTEKQKRRRFFVPEFVDFRFESCDIRLTSFFEKKILPGFEVNQTDQRCLFFEFLIENEYFFFAQMIFSGQANKASVKMKN